MPPDPPPPGLPAAVPAPCAEAPPPPARAPQRVALLGLGYACLGLAALGAVLPLLPTTVFLIIAAWAFGRASPALRERLLTDPRVGATLRNWQQHGAVSRRAKRAAVLAMALSWLVMTLAVRDVTISAIAGGCMAAVAAWLLTRPSTGGGPAA